tara:strand:+ start:256 stop:456 length:201 start_codon:yes stop_codon:yes gene_type:complete
MTQKNPTLADRYESQAKTLFQIERGHLMRQYLNSIKRKRRALKKERASKEIKKLAAQAGVNLQELM